MASSKEYLEFILGQLSELEEITYRAMMGEFIIYYRGKIVGGIYDDRLLVKPVKSAISYMPTAPYELPYEGAKEMLLVDEVDNKEFLTGLFNAMYEDFEMLADDCNCTGRFGVDAFCLALHGADLHIRSGAWSTKHGNCSAWRGCADYLFPAEWCDFAGYGIFDQPDGAAAGCWERCRV